MVTNVFLHFSVETNLDELGVDNRHKGYVYISYGKTGEYIHGSELCLWHAEAFLTNDEDEVVSAIKSIIRDREYGIEKLKNFII